MTDRELLELAAKASGLSVRHVLINGDLDVGADVSPWNPLTDDGDALRLAVKLRLRVCTETADGNNVYVSHDSIESVSENYNGDPYAATRRAIVRAAAAMV